jgi:hypothetical protein
LLQVFLFRFAAWSMITAVGGAEGQHMRQLPLPLCTACSIIIVMVGVWKYSKYANFSWPLHFFFSTGFYSPYRTLAFLNELLDPQTFGRTPWLGDQSNTRPLPTHRTTQHRNTQTSMPRVGFDPAISMFKRS